MNYDAKNPIETDRLILIPSANNRDLDIYIAHLIHEDDFYIQYGQPKSNELIEAIDFQSCGVICYSLFLKETPAMLGYVGIFPNEHDPASGELEFYIFKECRRQGFCKEALKTFIDRFFTGWLTGTKGEQVIAETMSDNKPSCKLLESIGFQRASCGIRISFNSDERIDSNSSFGICQYELNAVNR